MGLLACRSPQWNIRRGATKVSNNSLRACDKLTPQREGRGSLEEVLREAADLDRQGQRKLVPSRSHSAHPAIKCRGNFKATGLGQLGSQERLGGQVPGCLR